MPYTLAITICHLTYHNEIHSYRLHCTVGKSYMIMPVEKYGDLITDME